MLKARFHPLRVSILLFIGLLNRTYSTEIEITGKVLDHDRQPVNGALVRLVNIPVSATTDSVGTFRLSPGSTSIYGEHAASGKNEMPFIKNRTVHIPVNEEYCDLRIDFYRINGRKIGTFFKKTLHRGIHRLAISNLLNDRQASSLYVIQIHRGDERMIFKYSALTGDAIGNSKAVPVKDSFSSVGKTANAVIDTLIIEKNGYVRWRRDLSGYVAGFDSVSLFGKLTITHPVGGETYHIGDTMHITWEMNPGPQTGKLYFSLDGGNQWHLNKGLNLATKSYDLALTEKMEDVLGCCGVPATSDNFCIKITVNNFPEAGDESGGAIYVKE